MKNLTLNDYLKMPFAQKHLLSLQDYSRDEILHVLGCALALKKALKTGIPHNILQGKALAMIFAKPSTRTRASFDVGIHQLGGYSLFLSSADIQLGRGEPVSDTAKTLSRYVDGIMIRTFSHKDVEELAAHSSVPVINGLTDLLHPCQALADIMTMYEKKGTVNGLKLAFIGDGNNIVHSLLNACSKLGINISVACPNEYRPSSAIVENCMKYAAIAGSTITITDDPAAAIADADFVYTDVWTSMGQEQQESERAKIFAPYQINEKLFSLSSPDASFLHCLPAHRGQEVTSDVIDGPRSLVFDQAENRLHAQKAVMVLLMGQEKLEI